MTDEPVSESAEPPIDSADDQVRLTVDESACIGVGQCELLEPELFELDDDSGLAIVQEPGLLPRDRADKIIDRCPSGAISIVDR